MKSSRVFTVDNFFFERCPKTGEHLKGGRSSRYD